MRLFAGLVPPSAVLDDLDAACAPFRLVRDDLRWTGRELWHLTLVFLGEVSDEGLARLVPWLDRAAGHQRAFGLSVAGGGAFPNPARANVLWTGLAGDGGALAGLAASVAEAAVAAGITPADADRGFTPHLTLARCRAPVDVRDLVARLDRYRGPGWSAQEIHLIRSRLDRQPRYETLQTWKLQPAD